MPTDPCRIAPETGMMETSPADPGCSTADGWFRCPPNTHVVHHTGPAQCVLFGIQLWEINVHQVTATETVSIQKHIARKSHHTLRRVSPSLASTQPRSHPSIHTRIEHEPASTTRDGAPSLASPAPQRAASGRGRCCRRYHERRTGAARRPQLLGVAAGLRGAGGGHVQVPVSFGSRWVAHRWWSRGSPQPPLPLMSLSRRLTLT